MSTAFSGRGPPQIWDLKHGSISFAEWLWSVIAPAPGLTTIPDLLYKTVHMCIAYAYHTAPHTCDYMGYLRYVGHAARIIKPHI